MRQTIIQIKFKTKSDVNLKSGFKPDHNYLSNPDLNLFEIRTSNQSVPERKPVIWQNQVNLLESMKKKSKVKLLKIA